MANWDLRFLEMAKLVSSWSKDPSTQCGAVIIRPDKTIASTGFNGFPKGTADRDDFYQDRELKYARMMHAEVNAVVFAKEDLRGYTIYTYQDPQIGPSCDRCTTVVIQAGIKRVVHGGFSDNPRWNDSIARGMQMYKEAEVEVLNVNGPSIYNTN